MAEGPPPPPPLHGANPKSTSGGLPPGNYDIFIVPPHSSGSGFLYLPSLQPQRNSFIAGFASAVFCYLVWVTAVPVLGQWLSIIAASGGAGVLLLVAGVGVVAWAFGRTQGESKNQDARGPPPSSGGGHEGAGAGGNARYGHGPYNPSSHSSGPHSPPPHTPPHDYSSPPPRQEYRAPPPQPPPPPPPEYSAPPPPPPPPQPEYAAPPPQSSQQEYTAPPPQPRQQETPKPAPPPQPKPTPSPQPRATPPPQARAAPPPQPKPAPPPAEKPKPAPPPPPSPEPSTKSASDGPSKWEQAREETRKKEEARKRAEELKRLREEALRKKEEAERQARAAAEKTKWEQARAREKEAREREARELLSKQQSDKDKEAREKEKREREARERIAREKKEKAAAAAEAAKASPKPTTPTTPTTKKYERPSAKSYASTETTSAYDARTVISSSTASSYTETLSSYAPSTSTARTSPPPEYRGPYNTSDPDKIVIKAVYLYTNAMPKKPVSQLVTGEANVSDGLVLRLTTEGLFIDDDVRRVPQREWDVKAWSLKSIEKGTLKSHQILRATVRDLENKRYVFVIPSDQDWKLDVGIARLRKGNLVRGMGMSSLKAPEMTGLLSDLGWI